MAKECTELDQKEKDYLEQDKELKKKQKKNKNKTKQKTLISPHPLINIEIIEYFKNEPRFNGVSSRNNLPSIKKGACVINLDHSENTDTH